MYYPSPVINQYMFEYRKNVTSLFEYLQYRRRDDIDTRSLMNVRNQYRINPIEMTNLKNKVWNVYYGDSPDIIQVCPMCKSNTYYKMTTDKYQLNYIIPYSLGSLESQENLILLCSPCTDNMSDMETIFDYEQKVYNRNNCEAIWINQNIMAIDRPLIFVDTTCIPIKGALDAYTEQYRQEMRKDYGRWYQKEIEKKDMIRKGFIPQTSDYLDKAFNEICLMLDRFHL